MARGDDQDLLTTTEAGRLIGRSQGAVRAAVQERSLAGSRIEGRWYIERHVLLDWAQRSRPHRRRSTCPWERCAVLLAEHTSASAEELAYLSGLHVGNVRKYLAILAAQGRAERLPDGQWVLTALDQHGAA